ncbi:uncharacterized protein CIMG_13552 [Coccidioides immitis RS]|uniref:Uncharacterized protein n=1 Tax=Coccidioides immitis (strain RS) TaxID=246410 RepID=A0A0D8JVX9_COCIM|nr:uncharacterized protein CIMG_13552 [Coccidioides immitis RS]KJF61264.1 hypothetical protein CIMG_13552 [Coccidioides immitis RS]
MRDDRVFAWRRVSRRTGAGPKRRWSSRRPAFEPPKSAPSQVNVLHAYLTWLSWGAKPSGHETSSAAAGLDGDYQSLGIPSGSWTKRHSRRGMRFVLLTRITSEHRIRHPSERRRYAITLPSCLSTCACAFVSSALVSSYLHFFFPLDSPPMSAILSVSCPAPCVTNPGIRKSFPIPPFGLDPGVLLPGKVVFLVLENESGLSLSGISSELVANPAF